MVSTVHPGDGEDGHRIWPAGLDPAALHEEEWQKGKIRKAEERAVDRGT